MRMMREHVACVLALLIQGPLYSEESGRNVQAA